jgi:indole-3-glycerol phosphate synthase
MSILDDIIKTKIAEVDRLKRITSVEQLQSAEFFNRSGLSLASRLKANGSSGIIAEFKRRSPSKGVINDRSRAVDVAIGYEKAGASGVSVLTDSSFFGGSSQDLMEVRHAVSLPLLRKDFIIDAYQVYETKAMGADVILLIAANLERSLCHELAALANSLDLEVLLEIHRESELEHIGPNVSMVGINNRDLSTFQVDLKHSVRLGELVPQDLPRIAESGLSDHSNIRQLRASGFRGFLIGEYFMKQDDPGKACAQLISQLKESGVSKGK